MLDDSFVDIFVSAGRRRLSVDQLYSIKKGTLIELDKFAGEPMDVILQGRCIAIGEAVVIDENMGVRVTEVFEQEEK